MKLTTVERLRLLDLEDKLEAGRKSLAICNQKQEVAEWVDTKILIKQVQQELKALKAKQAK